MKRLKSKVLGICMLFTMLATSSVQATTVLEGMNANGTTLVPIRTLSEALGVSIDYEPSTKQITVETDYISTIMFPNNEIAMINYIPTKMVVAPQVIDGSTYVPIRFVGEALGANVGYNNGIVSITLNDTPKDFKLATTAVQVGEPTSEYGYRLIEVDGGNQSGHRESNVIVDIGFGDREYWAYTNEYGQLVRVVAEEIILQDEENEAVLSNGRYYWDEAKVPGVESPTLDEGHVIADSLGGVANAYNITPQNSTINRYGEQSDMEGVIRNSGGANYFNAIITYPDTQTQIPSYYAYTYTINGEIIHNEFANINSSEPNIDDVEDPVVEEVVPEDESKQQVEGMVYWTPNGKSYHTTSECRTLSRSQTILSGTQEESGRYDPCSVCN